MKKTVTTKPVAKKPEPKKAPAKKVVKKAPVKKAVKKAPRRLTNKDRKAATAAIMEYMNSAAWKKQPEEFKKLVAAALEKIKVN